MTALALLALPSIVAAQECIGLPSGRGILTYGFEGTDGATGQGLGFAYQTSNAAIIAQHRWLDGFTLIDELRTTDVQLSMRIPSATMPICITGGLERTSYDNDRLESESWTDNVRTTLIRVGGPYRRTRVPVGVAVGHEFELGRRVSLTPFFAPGLVYERETYTPESDSIEIRRTFGWRANGGVTASIGWFVLRSVIRRTNTQDYALSSQHNFLELTLQAGVRF